MTMSLSTRRGKLFAPCKVSKINDGLSGLACVSFLL